MPEGTKERRLLPDAVSRSFLWLSSLASEFALGVGDLRLLTSVYFLTFAAA